MDIERQTRLKEAGKGYEAQFPGVVPYEGVSYYGLPAVKAGYYHWLVAAYFFIGGLASAAQFLAAAIDLTGGQESRSTVRTGRYLALLGALVSPPLLIADLHTPRRWYNMLRIFRRTSAMSIGSWSLSAFGIFSGLAAVGQAVDDIFKLKAARWLARLAGLPAALFGGVVAIYTGTLLAATNIPLWISGFPFLSSLFASSAASTATAALTLATPVIHERIRRRLSAFALVAGIAEFIFSSVINRRWRRQSAAAPFRDLRLGSTWYLGVFGLGIIGPFIVHLFHVLTGRESRRVTTLSAIATLIGGFLLRIVFIFGGRESAENPQDYLRLTHEYRNLGKG
jgi:formate-dependent nitrite reductase membrane component NrfD